MTHPAQDRRQRPALVFIGPGKIRLTVDGRLTAAAILATALVSFLGGVYACLRLFHGG